MIYIILLKIIVSYVKKNVVLKFDVI